MAKKSTRKTKTTASKPATISSPIKSGDRPIGATILAVLYAIFGGLMVLGGLILTMGGSMFGNMMGSMDYQMIGALGAGLFGIIGIVVIIMGALHLLTAYGLWMLTSWGKILATIFGALGLLGILSGNFLGFLLGAATIYLLWFHEETKKAFA